jgi:hypothetical protein
MAKAVAGILAFGLIAFAQSEEARITVRVEGFRYPPIARAARIQGDVIFEVFASEPRLITSAHPILTEAARKNLETWTPSPFEGEKYIVRYHFSLSGRPGRKSETMLVGDPFDRFFLRLFHAPTEKVVEVCDNDAPTETQLHHAGNQGGNVIDVFVTTRDGCSYAP